jgi:hypothetical protein
MNCTIKYPSVTPGTCKININYMYITCTFVIGRNLAGLLVLKVIVAVALPVTFLIAVEDVTPSFTLGALGGLATCLPPF